MDLWWCCCWRDHWRTYRLHSNCTGEQQNQTSNWGNGVLDYCNTVILQREWKPLYFFLYFDTIFFSPCQQHILFYNLLILYMLAGCWRMPTLTPTTRAGSVRSRLPCGTPAAGRWGRSWNTKPALCLCSYRWPRRFALLIRFDVRSVKLYSFITHWLVIFLLWWTCFLFSMHFPAECFEERKVEDWGLL